MPLDQKTIVAALIAVARAAYILADNAAYDHTIAPGGTLLCDTGDMDKLAQMLDVLDRWPDPPGEAATGPRKSEYWYSVNAIG